MRAAASIDGRGAIDYLDYLDYCQFIRHGGTSSASASTA
jgi:hypothetical protein